MPVWRYVGAGDVPAGESERFTDRDAAEAWLAESWERLRDDGVVDVVLVDEDGATIYRMPLAPSGG